MELETIMSIIIGTVLTPLIGAAIAKLITLIDENIKDKRAAKYINMTLDAVHAAVKDVAQTYVDALKKDGRFDEKAKKEAFALAMVKVKNIMGANAYKTLAEIYGDVEQWLQSNIEAASRDIKGGGII